MKLSPENSQSISKETDVSPNLHATTKLEKTGFSFARDIYSELEVDQICKLISGKDLNSNSILKSKHLFAIRQLMIEIPELKGLILNEKFKALLNGFETENELFLTKAIYFDKPEDSNWFVAYHQDLTINVIDRKEVKGFINWTNKRGQIGVQPPIEYLERTVTLRIHLDDTNESNGALRVSPYSHRHGVIRPEDRTELVEEVTCNVKRGGVMLMKPLTLHASSKSTGYKNRRVIHLEFCDMELPEGLDWKERMEVY